MKLIHDLKLAVTNESFISDQFKINGTKKNILFVNPQLSTKHLYKSLLPLYKWRSEEVATAITSLSEFDTESQLYGENEWLLTDEMINWGKDVGVPVYIVFPFTVQPLVSEVYALIRETNPFANIVYSVDFNYYELSENHPFKSLFSEQSVIAAVEDNMIFSDIIIVSNYILCEVLAKKLQELIDTKYVNDIGHISIKGIGVLNLFIDIETIIGNVDYDIQEAISSSTVHTTSSNELIEKTTEVADKVREQEKIKKNSKATKKKPKGSSYKGTQKNKLKKQIKKEKADPKTYGKTKPTKRTRSKRATKK